LVEEPLWIFPVGWQDRLPRGSYPTRSGLHQDIVLPPSERSPEERVLRVHLPEAYLRDPHRNFPLVFCLDGQNCFDASTAYGGVEWSLDDVALQFEAEGGQPSILVGVDNGESRRMYEYSFCPPPRPPQAEEVDEEKEDTADADASEAAGTTSKETASASKPKPAKKAAKPRPPPEAPEGGGAKEHLDFILYDVVPLIRERFRVEPGPASLVGSSMGGLFGLWAAVAHPGAFRSIGVVSPSVWWANEAVLRLPLGDGPRPRVWIDMGTREGRTSVQQFRAAVRRLTDLGWTEGTDLCPLLVEGGTHHESAWADRAGSIMRFLLARG
jgi:predicted alpha/beta superfamily hydrolase